MTAAPMARHERARRWLGAGLPVALLLLAGWVLWREFRHLSLADVAAEMRSWGPPRLAAAASLTVASFGALTLLERLGLGWAAAKAPWRAVLAAGFCANAFAHAIGFALLTGSAVRARLYARHGVSWLAATQVGLFRGVAFGLGMSIVGGAALLGAPRLAVAGIRLDPALQQAAGAVLLGAPVAYLAACGLLRRSLSLFGRSIALPSAPVALAQSVLGAVDCAATAGIAWVLLPAGLVGYWDFAGAYLPATLLGLASHVPGGAGVFEGAVLALLPGASRPALAAAFLGYRLIYYALPLCLSAPLLMTVDRRAARRRASRAGKRLAEP